VFFRGEGRHWADGRGTTPADRADIDDVGFIVELIARLSSEFSIDSSRVYATGISNGGFMAELLACRAADRFTAVAAVAATLPVAVATTCQPARPISVLLMHGTNDPLVPYRGGEVVQGGAMVKSAPATASAWARLNGCATGRSSTDLPDTSDDGTRVRLDRFACPGNTAVALYTIDGGGHTWPGGEQYLPVRLIGRTSRDIDASSVIAQFFNQ
jgi:polyhydroxybutyrate depolymerase